MYFQPTTVKQLIETRFGIIELLRDINQNGIWPDENPNWDLSYYENDTESQIQNNINFLNKSWLLSEIVYSNEIISVKFSKEWIDSFNAHYEETFSPIPEWASSLESRYFYVIGEVAQRKNHFLLIDIKTGIILPGEFHNSELQIVLDEYLTNTTIIKSE